MILDLILCAADEPAAFGLSMIDHNLTELIKYMGNEPPAFLNGTLTSYAKTIGCCIALGVGANECYQMMLGRKGMDVMKILHIILISFCITWSGAICSALKTPGEKLEETARAFLNTQNDHIQAREEQMRDLQDAYIEAVRKKNAELLTKAQADRQASDDKNWYDPIADPIMDMWQEMKNKAQELTLIAETTLCEWISKIIRYIGEVLFQAMLYGVVVGQRIFMQILAAFAPLMFAISLSPHFKSAWSQWLGKYVSISLWSFIAYTITYYVFYIIDYNLLQDIEAYKALTARIDVDGDGSVLAIGMQALGSTCMYIVGCLIGVKLLGSVSEVASWCMPGGVASSSTGAMTGAMAGGGSYVGAKAGSTLAKSAGSIGNQAGRNLNWANNYKP